MIDRGRHNLLGIQINAIDYEAAVESIVAAAREQRSMGISALAVHGVMTGVLDRHHAARLNKLDLVVPDGQPVRWALNLLHGTNLTDRVYGPTLTLKVCERAASEDLSVYLYGSRPEILSKLQRNLSLKFPRLRFAGAQASKFRQVTISEKQEIIEQINQSGASIVLVGLGCPRQEVWVYEHRGLIRAPMLAVGAAFDFHAGVLPQAPQRLQRMGLEWAFRLVQEPGRLWKRYLYLNPLYISLVSLQLFKLRAFPLTEALPPQDSLRYG